MAPLTDPEHRAGWLRRVIPARLRGRFRAGWNRVRAPLLPEPYRTVYPYTMVGLRRLRALRDLAQRVDQFGIRGDVVECGTCNGGSGAVLADVVRHSSFRRHVWLLDSFEGLPPAGPKDGPVENAYTGLYRGDLARVREVFRLCAVPDDAFTLVPGWFHDTLPRLPVSTIALLHIDADWYDSVHLVLEHLYDRVAPGGFVVIDDYGYWEGCRRACDEYLAARGAEPRMVRVDSTGVYFQKPVSVDS